MHTGDVEIEAKKCRYVDLFSFITEIKVKSSIFMFYGIYIYISFYEHFTTQCQRADLIAF